MNEFISEFSLGDTDGPRIAIKDSIDIAGHATTAASRALADAPPAAAHAEVVDLLLKAGWQITGKANMHELAFGMTGINDYTGTPENPQDDTLIPGGSSSGSASIVGLHLADAALGTDTGGSVRGPAACCGVLGMKPTFGRVSRRGVAPVHTTLDCVGPLAREMLTLVDVMAAITPGFNESLAYTLPHRLKVGIVTADATAEMNGGVTDAAAITGLSTQACSLEHMRAAFDAGLVVINAETWQAFGHLVGTGKLGADLEARLRNAARTTAADVEAAEAVRRTFTAEVDRLLESVDAILLPTLPDLPITIEQARGGTSVIAMSSLIRPFNLSGHPALSMPMRIDGTLLRGGLQIVSRKGADELVCALATQIETSLALP